ncbi:MAG: hypothetical protein K1V94_01085, partial [Duncaniella dubosii]|uniref:hypothetical protein n=1 Tax=Duncaniella dubosii TaxID=2518971 RepID=UPI00352778DD
NISGCFLILQSYFVVFDIEPRRARTMILKTTKKFPCRIIDRGHFYFARRGQSRVPEGVKLSRLFQPSMITIKSEKVNLFVAGPRNIFSKKAR